MSHDARSRPRDMRGAGHVLKAVMEIDQVPHGPGGTRWTDRATPGRNCGIEAAGSTVRAGSTPDAADTSTRVNLTGTVADAVVAGYVVARYSIAIRHCRALHSLSALIQDRPLHFCS
jgi:hypothetical protein